MSHARRLKRQNKLRDKQTRRKSGRLALATLETRFEQDVVEFHHKSDDYYRALEGVTVCLGQLEILSVANGGQDTARAFGQTADALSSAYNQFIRAVQACRANPMMQFDEDGLRQLGERCNVMRQAANGYANADKTQWSAWQRAIAEAVAQTKPLIAALRAAQKRPASAGERRIVADMLIKRRQGGMNDRAALENLKRSEPAVYAAFFPHQDDQARLAYARKLRLQRKNGEI